MNDRNNNDYDEFFKSQAQGEEDKHSDNSGGETLKESESQSKPSYYYSYGPFKSTSNENSGSNGYGSSSSSSSSSYSSYRPANQANGYETGASQSESQPVEQLDNTASEEREQSVEVTPPPQLRSFSTGQQGGGRGGWQVREPKRKSSFRSLFAAFLAGVIVVGGLMWASDSYNWFGGTNAVSLNSSGTSESASPASSSTSASTVAARPDDLAQLFDTASPAVVKITTYVNPTNQRGSSLMDDPFFRQFFGGGSPDSSQSQQNGNDNQLQESGIGTGFFFDSNGYILTNQHVIADSDKIEVTVQGYDEPFTAELLGSDYDLDLAVLKVTNDKAFSTLTLGSSDDIKIGDWVVAIGNPYGFDHTITAGVLSAKERPISISDEDGTRNYQHLLQTDASINPGNSGGPLLNTEGEVIGINTAVSSEAQGIGFAIPTSTINEVLDDLKNGKAIAKDPVPFIGATLMDVSDSIAQQLGLSEAKGAFVTAITYNSPAYKADLRQYDVILSMDGKAYDKMEDLIAAIQKHEVGDKVTLTIIRNGKTMDLQVEIGDKNQFNVE